MVLFTIAGGELIPDIEMPSSATILELKQRINEVLYVDVDRQILLFNNVMLEDDRFIQSFGFHPFTTLVLFVTPLPGEPKFNITLKSSTKEDQIRVRETQKVADLRKKIGRRWGILTEKITLLHLSKEMEDNLPLSAYYVSQDSEVEVKVIIEPR